MAPTKRVFVLEANNFPRGSANANYIQYLSLALKDDECNVIVGGNEKNISTYRNGFIKDIEYCNVPWKKKYITSFNYSLLKTLNKKYIFSENDYFVLYSIDYLTIKWLLKKVDISHICVCQVEDMQPFQFKFGKFNPKVQYLKLSAKFIRNKKIKLLPISSFIAKQYPSNPVLILPIMADTSEYTFIEKGLDKENINFIYPGLKKSNDEDDMELVLKSLRKLSDEKLKRIKLHITGAKREEFLARYKVKKEIEEILEIHGWMEYEELVKLYEHMDYLLLIRKINNVTRANFPSKIPELMAFGVIPVCTKVGDYTEYYLTNDKDSIFASEEGVQDCYNAINKAINLDKDVYAIMRLNARKLVENKFDYKIWQKKIKKFIFE